MSTVRKKAESSILKLNQNGEVKALPTDNTDEFDENIEEMNLNTLNMMTGQSDDTYATVIFSNVKDSGMNVFNEDVLEEVRQADVRPSHKPYGV